MEKFGKPDPWNLGIIIFCVVAFVILNFFAAGFFWKLGLKNLKKLEY
jgi:F0F1-type ATP synthase membrane subunit b/b'